MKDQFDDGKNGSVIATNADGHEVILFADGATEDNASPTIEEKNLDLSH
jgi:hypothetical protein